MAWALSEQADRTECAARNLAADTLPGRTHWFTLGTVVFALCFGATALMFSIVLSVQRYFEHQIEQGRKISQ